MADGFLGRWSQRKQAVRAGKPLDEPVHKPAPLLVPCEKNEVASVRPELVEGAALRPDGGVNAGAPKRSAEALPTQPTLEDAQALTTESDFSPFAARDVAPEVRNAAMKKLFTDPRYNVMDGLDIYIDDYSKPDPLPESMLRQMVSAKFLKLFEDKEEPQPGQALGDDAHTPGDHSVAQSAQSPLTAATPLTDNQPPIAGTDHDHTDLRLQPNHAAGAQEPGRGTE